MYLKIDNISYLSGINRVFLIVVGINIKIYGVLGAFKDRLKVYSGKKYLRQKWGRMNVPEEPSSGIRYIGCIVDMDAFQDPETFFTLRRDFDLNPNGVQIIGYKRVFDRVSPFGVQYFTDRDLGWNGKIESGHVKEFLTYPYDVLINYYEKDALLLKLLTVSTRARIRVGLGEADTRLNDLILDAHLEDIEQFKTELKKYLKLLDEF